MCEIISMRKWKRARQLSGEERQPIGVDRRARPRGPVRNTGGLVQIGFYSAEVIRRLE